MESYFFISCGKASRSLICLARLSTTLGQLCELNLFSTEAPLAGTGDAGRETNVAKDAEAFIIAPSRAPYEA